MNVGATKKIRPDQLTGTLAESLLEWEQENEERFFRAIDDAADACNETAGQYLTPGHGYKTGEYKRHFAIERQLTGRHSYSATWHVEAPHYRLTHLLENGHLTRDGTKHFNPRSREGSDNNFHQKVLFSLSKNCLIHLFFITNFLN